MRSAGVEVPWWAVLKVLVRRDDDDRPDPASWNYWRREAAFYGSDLAATIPGRLRAPRPYSVVERDDRASVWMEYVAVAPRPWTHDDFRRAARAAGESAGAFLAGRPLPAEPWLSEGFLRSILADGDFWATTMHPETGQAWRSPLSEPFGAVTRERVAQLWADRDALLAVVDHLPRVLGHGDLHPRNILLPVDREEVVALDWGFCGPAPIGGDLADLIFLSAWFCDTEVADLAGIEAAAFAGYRAGLRAAGWDGDPRLVRLGYALHVALRMGACMPGWAVLMLDDERGPSSEALYHRSVDGILAAWIELAEISLDPADEARTLAREIGLDRQ